MDPLKIIEKYYKPDTAGYSILVDHSRLVMNRCLEIAGRIGDLHPDISFLKEAAMLHDIGIFMTSAPHIGCHGSLPYICHGFLGRELLEAEGLPGHALVCERHVGVGLTLNDIKGHELPLPHREMLPITLEEKIICYADKFFSKKTDGDCAEKSFEEVRQSIERYGLEQVRRFDELAGLFQ